jgi:hypothetical protein
LFQWEFCPCVVFWHLKSAAGMFKEDNHVTMISGSRLGCRGSLKLIMHILTEFLYDFIGMP